MVPYLKKRLTHKFGWMALLPSQKTYNFYFDNVDQITNITYQSKFYGFKVTTRPSSVDASPLSADLLSRLFSPQPDQYLIINHNFTQSPDSFHIIDRRNGSAAPLSFSNNSNGDWYFSESSNNLYYMGQTHFYNGSVD